MRNFEFKRVSFGFNLVEFALELPACGELLFFLSQC